MNFDFQNPNGSIDEEFEIEKIKVIRYSTDVFIEKRKHVNDLEWLYKACINANVNLMLAHEYIMKQMRQRYQETQNVEDLKAISNCREIMQTCAVIIGFPLSFILNEKATVAKKRKAAEETNELNKILEL